MNMKVLSFVVLLFAFSSSYAQPVIHFEQRLHDFGTIKEVNGTVSYNFVSPIVPTRDFTLSRYSINGC